jgi:hypothetical protein
MRQLSSGKFERKVRLDSVDQICRLTIITEVDRDDMICCRVGRKSGATQSRDHKLPYLRRCDRILFLSIDRDSEFILTLEKMYEGTGLNLKLVPCLNND